MNKVEKSIVKTSSGMRRFSIQVNLPRKKIFFSTPSFFIEPKSYKDLNFVCNWATSSDYDSGCFQGLVIPYNQTKRLLLPYESKVKQLTLTGESKEEAYSKVIKNKLILIDPLTESAYFKNGYSDNDLLGLPEDFKNQIKKINDKKNPNKRIDKIRLYREHLEDISKKINNYTLRFLAQLKNKQSDILLSPSNLIIPEVPESLDLAIRINEETHKICADDEGWIPAAYFVLKTSVFESSKSLRKILEYINKEKPSMVFFKIVDSYGLDSRNASIQRDNLKQFLKSLSYISDEFHIPSFFLNVDSLGLFLIQAKIDGFSTPSNGIVEQIFVPYKNTNLPNYLRGKYFLVERLSFISMLALEEIYTMRRKTFPCPYGCCNRFNKHNFDTFIGDTKLNLTRIHYFNSMNNLILESHHAINNGTARAAFNKLANSSCSHYLEILPDFN